MKLYSFLLYWLLLVSTTLSAQSVTGEWFGVGNINWAGEFNSYLYELTLKQSGDKVTGELVYYFRNVVIKTKVTGIFYSKTRTLELNARPIINYMAKDKNGADCPMEGSFTLRTSRVETSLTGQFNPTYSYRFTCPAVNIKFKKEQPGQENEKPKPGNATEPLELDLPLEKIVKDQTPKIIIDTTVPIVAALNKRVFESAPVIDVESDSLKVTLYDNGEVDNDTISLFYNRQLVAYKKMLSNKPLVFMLPVDTSINEIAMFAENLGGIPPNTAVAIIYAGDKRYELFMTSNFIKNATIRFRKKPAIIALQ